MQHFQALLRIDTSSPPGNETRAVEYLKQVFEKEGIPYQVFAKDPSRANIVARIKGSGKKRPILILGPHRRGHGRSRRSGRTRRSARCVTAATSTDAARSTTRTTWSRA